MKSKLLLLSALTLGVFAMAQIPTSGLVAHYSFSGNANDLSGNGNNGTVNGATLTTDRSGNLNSAYSFNGTTSYIDIPHSSSLTFTSNAISVSFWAKVISVPSSGFNGLILSKQSGSGTTQQGLNLTVNTSQSMGLTVKNGSGGVFSGSGNNTFSLNQYHHFVYIYDNGTGIAYMDGVQSSNSPGQTGIIGLNTMNLLIGKANWSNINALNFDGVIDEMQIYNRTITPIEVNQIFNSTCTTPNITTGLVARYNFTGNANDVSGNANNGTVNGATLTTDRFGNANSAYLFNGTSSYIDVPHSSSLTFTANAISVSFWAKIISVPASGYNGLILSKQSGSGASQQGFNVFDNTSQTVGLAIRNGAATVSGSNNYSVTLNQYHHFAYTFDNGTSVSYLNGVQTSSLTGQTASLGANTMNLLIGKANWVNINALNFNGVIDDIEIYNRALSSCDADSLFNIPNLLTTGISKHNLNSTFSLYPNPANDKVSIEININENQNVTIEILDLMGRTIQKQVETLTVGYNKLEVNLSNLNSGLYLIKCNNSIQKIQITK